MKRRTGGLLRKSENQGNESGEGVWTRTGVVVVDFPRKGTEVELAALSLMRPARDLRRGEREVH